jgi:hypothetical protein
MKLKDRELTFEEKVDEFVRTLKPLPNPRLWLRVSKQIGREIEAGATVTGIVVRGKDGVVIRWEGADLIHLDWREKEPSEDDLVGAIYKRIVK